MISPPSPLLPRGEFSQPRARLIAELCSSFSLGSPESRSRSYRFLVINGVHLSVVVYYTDIIAVHDFSDIIAHHDALRGVLYDVRVRVFFTK